MKKLRPSSEDEMILEFLGMEIQSHRFQEKMTDVLDEMGLGRDIILNGDIASVKENALRKEILGQFRGYGKDAELFKDFPKQVEWWWSVFDGDDLSKIRYIDYSYWNELSNYSGSPIEAAKTIKSGKTIYDVPNDNFIEIARKLRAGHIFPPMIFLTDKAESRYVILEGHARMTGYGLYPEAFRDVSVLLGYCVGSELDKWNG